jgi:hypothetical protein
MLATVLGICVAAVLMLLLVGDWVRHPGDVDESGVGPSPQLRPAQPLRSLKRGDLSAGAERRR